MGKKSGIRKRRERDGRREDRGERRIRRKRMRGGRRRRE